MAAKKRKKFKVTIIVQDTDSDTLEMKIKYSPSVPGGTRVESPAVAFSTAFIKFIGERNS